MIKVISQFVSDEKHLFLKSLKERSLKALEMRIDLIRDVIGVLAVLEGSNKNKFLTSIIFP